MERVRFGGEVHTNGNGTAAANGALEIPRIYSDYAVILDSLYSLGPKRSDEFVDVLGKVAFNQDDAINALLLTAMATSSHSAEIPSSKREIGTLLYTGAPSSGKTTLLDAGFNAFGYRPEEVGKVPLHAPAQRLPGLKYKEVTDGQEKITTIPGYVLPHHKALRVDEWTRVIALNALLDVSDTGVMINDEGLIVLNALQWVGGTANLGETVQATSKMTHAQASRINYGVAMNRLSARDLVGKTQMPAESVHQLIDDEEVQKLRTAANTDLLPIKLQEKVADYTDRIQTMVFERYNFDEDPGRLYNALGKAVISLYILDGKLPNGGDWAKKVLGYMQSGKLSGTDYYKNLLSGMIAKDEPLSYEYVDRALKYVVPQRLAAAGRRIMKKGQRYSEAVEEFTDEVKG